MYVYRESVACGLMIAMDLGGGHINRQWLWTSDHEDEEVQVKYKRNHWDDLQLHHTVKDGWGFLYFGIG
jgi:hypothetical protein